MSEVRSIQGLRLLALALAMLTWYFVRLDHEGAATNTVSFTNEYTIQYTVPDTMVALESTEKVQITIQGRESIVEKFNPFLVRVQVDLQNKPARLQEIELTEANVTLPEGLTVTAFEPSVITVQLDLLVSQLKSVLQKPEGEPAAGATVRDVTVTPPLVTVTGPASILQDYESVYTRPIDVNGHAIDFHERTIIELPHPSLSIPDGDRVVSVFVTFNLPGAGQLEDISESEATSETPATEPPSDIP